MINKLLINRFLTESLCIKSNPPLLAWRTLLGRSLGKHCCRLRIFAPHSGFVVPLCDQRARDGGKERFTQIPWEAKPRAVSVLTPRSPLLDPCWCSFWSLFLYCWLPVLTLAQC